MLVVLSKGAAASVSFLVERFCHVAGQPAIKCKLEVGLAVASRVRASQGVVRYPDGFVDNWVQDFGVILRDDVLMAYPIPNEMVEQRGAGDTRR